MARYVPEDQSKLLPVIFAQQITPGTFEHTVSFLIDEHLDMSAFDGRYQNDETGRPAYNPAMLLRVILSAYARGHTSSRQIEQLCRENVVFMALSGDNQPHFTTIARFVAEMGDVVQSLFTQVLMVCDQEGLIGGHMFAIDGCKMPSNASREWSGTVGELNKKQKKIDRAVRRMLKKHREEDDSGQVNGDTRRAAEEKNIESLRKASQKIKKYCAAADERIGLSGKPVKGNITDGDSATMLTSHGGMQGYNGVAAVDDQHQIVVAAEAYGQGPENNLLQPMIEQVRDRLGEEYVAQALVTADAGFHSERMIEFCEKEEINALIADGNFRKRDPRFADRKRHQPKSRHAKHFSAAAFTYDPIAETCNCPAGKSLRRSHTTLVNNVAYVNFAAALTDCRSCPLQDQCMRKGATARGRQVSFRQATETKGKSAIERMKAHIDSPSGRYEYSRRLGAVEPVFGNINTAKRMDRFRLRGKYKVNSQWLMYCMVHNVEKLQRYGQMGR
jgi:transposase